MSSRTLFLSGWIGRGTSADMIEGLSNDKSLENCQEIRFREKFLVLETKYCVSYRCEGRDEGGEMPKMSVGYMPCFSLHSEIWFSFSVMCVCLNVSSKVTLITAGQIRHAWCSCGLNIRWCECNVCSLFNNAECSMWFPSPGEHLQVPESRMNTSLLCHTSSVSNWCQLGLASLT